MTKLFLKSTIALVALGLLVSFGWASATARAGGVADGSPSSTQVEASSVQDIVKGVKATYGGVTALRADFTQVTRSQVSGETRQKGKLMLKRPSKMSWEFKEPDSKQFVTDGQTMWVWTAVDNQVIVTGDIAAQDGDMVELLEDLSKLDELFEIRVLPGTAQSHVLELTPKKNAAFKRLELVLEKKKYTLEKLTMTDQFDGVVELAFTQVKINPELEDSSFVFSIPPGAQVIRSDGM